jgi:hypothetical protein
VKFLKILKEYLVTTLTILFIISIFVGIVLIVVYLNKTGKKLRIIPEFKIIDSKDEPDIDSLSESVHIAKDILTRIKK